LFYYKLLNFVESRCQGFILHFDHLSNSDQSPIPKHYLPSMDNTKLYHR